MQTQVNVFSQHLPINRANRRRNYSPIARVWPFLRCLMFAWGLVTQCIFPYAAASAADQWSPAFEQQQVILSVQVVPNNNSASDSLININAKVLVKAAPDDFFALLENATQDCTWLAHCQSVAILDDSLPNHRFVHTVLSSPWPLQDREMYTHSIHQFNPDRTHLSIWIEDNSQPYPRHPKRELVRVKQAQWSMVHHHDAWYELNYFASIEPGGHLPVWLNKRVLSDATQNTMRAIRNRLMHTTPDLLLE